MANPIFNDKAAAEASRSGWGAPAPGTRSTPIDSIPPITDGPVTPWHSGLMTVGGTATATGVLLVVLLAAAAAGWVSTKTAPGGAVQFPGLAIAGVIVGLGCAIALRFRPMWAKFLGPVYAVAEGFFVGAISKAYDARYEGIVLQAVGATLAVFAVMLLLYKSRIIKVTDRFRRIVLMATMGLMAFYAISLVINLFGGKVGFLHSSSPIGILFSVFAAGLAAMMLAVDFDLIERGAKAGWPKGMEWYAAFGLLVTLVWLYLELLRLLAKLQDRR